MSQKKILSDVLRLVINGERIAIKKDMYVPEWVADSLKEPFKPSRTFFRNKVQVLSAKQLASSIQALDLSLDRALIYASYLDEPGHDLTESFFRSTNAKVLKGIPAAFADLTRKVIGNIDGNEIRTIENERLRLDYMPDFIKNNWFVRAAVFPFTKNGHEVLTKEKAQELIDLVASITSRQREQQLFTTLFDRFNFDGLISSVNKVQKKNGASNTRPEILDDTHSRIWRPEGFELWDSKTDQTFDQTVTGLDIIIPNRYPVTGISQKAFDQMLARTKDVDQLFITGIIDQYPRRLKELLRSTSARHIYIDRSVYIALKKHGWKMDKRFKIFNFQDKATRAAMTSPSFWEQQTVLPGRYSMFDIIAASFGGQNNIRPIEHVKTEKRKKKTTMFDILEAVFGLNDEPSDRNG